MTSKRYTKYKFNVIRQFYINLRLAQYDPPVSDGSSMRGVELPNAKTIELRSFLLFDSILASRSYVIHNYYSKCKYKYIRIMQLT